MPFPTTTERSLCNKLLNDWGGLLTPLNSANGIIGGYASSLDSQLRNMQWSGTSALLNGISTLNSVIGNAIPGSTLNDMRALKQFLDQCVYLNGNNPLSAVLNTSKGIFNLIDDTLNSLYGTMPEFGVGKIAGYINQLLKGLGIPGGDMLSDIFKTADQLLNCLSQICYQYDPSYYGSYITSYTNQLDSLYTSMNIVSDPLSQNWGLFDYDTLYSNVGLTQPQISDINLVIDAVDTVKETSLASVTSSITVVKDLLGEGGFFA
jgi:hypothetical protein